MERQYYDAKVIVRKNGQIKVTNFDKPIIKDDEKIACGGQGRVSAEDCKNSDTSIRIDSLSRSRNTLIEYCCENQDEFKTFITLTFKENITDLSYANREFHKFTSKVSRRCKNLGFEYMYIGVPEFQKRGAVHYHLLTNLPVNSEIIPKQKKPLKLWNKKEKRYIKVDYYNLPFWTTIDENKNKVSLGFSSAFDIVGQVDNNFSLVKYILKYLYKDLDDRLYGRTRVLKSNNLTPPNIMKLKQDSEEYQSVMSWIKEKGYDIENQFTWQSTDENSYIIPGKLIEYIGLQEDNITLRNVLQK